MVKNANLSTNSKNVTNIFKAKILSYGTVQFSPKIDKIAQNLLTHTEKLPLAALDDGENGENANFPTGFSIKTFIIFHNFSPLPPLMV